MLPSAPVRVTSGLMFAMAFSMYNQPSTLVGVVSLVAVVSEVVPAEDDWSANSGGLGARRSKCTEPHDCQ